MSTTPETAALASVLAERQRQDAKWGEQNHDPSTYLTILMEEVGEMSQATLLTRFGGHSAEGLREEAVQVAAVALAIVECLDRGTWRWPEDGYAERIRELESENAGLRAATKGKTFYHSDEAANAELDQLRAQVEQLHADLQTLRRTTIPIADADQF